MAPTKFSWLLVSGGTATLYFLAGFFLLGLQWDAFSVAVILSGFAIGTPFVSMCLEETRTPRDIFKLSRLVKVSLVLTATLFLASAWGYQLYGWMVSTDAVVKGIIFGVVAAVVWRFASWRRHKKQERLDAFNTAARVAFHFMTVPLMTSLLVMTILPQFLHQHWQLTVAILCLVACMVWMMVVGLVRRKRRRASDS